MATVRFYLRKKVLADGTSPLVLKIYKDGKPSISHTGISLVHEHWDKKNRRVRKTHPNSTQLNNMLLKKLAEANNKAIAKRSTTTFLQKRSSKRSSRTAEPVL